MTSSIYSLVRIWKRRHSGPGCSFVWILRVVYFPVKHSCLYNKYEFTNYMIVKITFPNPLQGSDFLKFVLYSWIIDDFENVTKNAEQKWMTIYGYLLTSRGKMVILYMQCSLGWVSSLTRPKCCTFIEHLHKPAIANPFLSYSSLSKVFSINSATSAHVILPVVPVLHCPSSTLYFP